MWEPLNLGYLAAYVKKYIPDLEIEVFSQAFDSDNEIIHAAQNADFAGFGCTTPQMKNALELAYRMKLVNPGIRTVFGGYHPSSMAFETRQNNMVDHAVVGEGEEGLLSLLKGNRMGVIISEPVEDLDSLPVPDRQLMKAERHIEVAQKETKERITSVQASRGCPFRCLPCSNVNIHGAHIRVRTAANVIMEMKMLQQQFNLDFIKFCDATFNTSISRVMEFSKQAQELGLNIPWGANIHPAIGSLEMFQEMKKAGCRELWIGAESGSPKILKELRKGVTVDRIKEVFKWTKELGFIRRAYFLIGSPSENAEDIALTEKLAEELDADVYGVTILCPYPGTDLFDSGKYSAQDWSRADEYGNTFYRNKSFTNEELWKIRTRLADKFKNSLCFRLRNK